MIPQISLWISLILLAPIYGHASAETNFVVEEEIDVHYKKQVPIYLQHELGDVSIQGWNQDLIRVKLKKSVSADTEENARAVLKKYTLISLETPNAIEMRIGSPQGTDLLTKLRTRQQKKNIKVDLEIKAPTSLPFSALLGIEKKLRLTQWRGKINITGKKNNLELTKIRSTSPMSVNCPDCSFTVSDSDFSGSILVGDQKVELKKVTATPEPILIFSQKGEINLEEVMGNFQIRTQSGDVTSKKNHGSFQVQTESGKIKLEDFDGDLDIQSKTGSIKVLTTQIKNQVELKNQSGDISLTLPHDFSGDVNLQSIKGEVLTDFSIQKDKKKMEMLYGPELKGRIFGKIGSKEKTSILISSESGNIDLKRMELPQ